MRCLSLLLGSLLVVGFAHADEPLTGKFRLRVPEEAVRLSKVAGKSPPAGRLVLLAEGRFDLDTDGAIRHGRFRTDDGKLVLAMEDGAELRGERKGDKIVVEGLEFERETPVELKGLWTVRQNGQEQKGLKMDLKADGKFKFSMAGATSEGTWSVVDGKLLLVWSKIDGEDVEPGTVRKEIPLSEDGGWFKIDTYRYERAGA
ncbi:hypothetical protein EON82_07565 [bacterium]|nr:MAG: hypothetical protein EON82_07565 [bacterium]